ncbi:MAG: hypothetical protein AABW73_01865 [Nanoarchaeota archaeon]
MEFDDNKLASLFSDKSKRKSLTSRQKIYFWENPRQYTRTCSICQERIIKIPDVEIDRTKEFSSNNNKLLLTHKECNRMIMKAEKRN